MTWDERGPVRVRIVDPGGSPRGDGFRAVAPAASRPYIGQEGTAVKKGATVEITLDSGHVIYGYQCWWEIVEPEIQGEHRRRAADSRLVN